MKLSLLELARRHLMVTGAGCHDLRYLPIDKLIKRSGPQHTLGHIAPRRRSHFRFCRQAPASVKLVSGLNARKLELWNAQGTL